MTTQLWSVVVILVGCVIGAYGALYFKFASGSFSLEPRNLLKNKKLLFGAVLYGLSAVMFVIALRGGELSVLYPLTSTGYIWVSLLSIKYLNEKVSVRNWISIILIIIGVSLIGFAG